MANVMSMKSVRNKPHRDGFDLSKRNLFTAKIGELLPVYCKEVLPGDKFKINQKWFTRTRPVNTAAYTRIREYYDWFFVPTNLLWNKFETFISQTKENPFHAASINDAQYTNDTHPFMNVSEIYDFLFRLSQSPASENFFGFDRATLSCKLLHYLGYGDYYNWNDPGSSFLYYRENVALNPFPLLAYQKVFQDYFRNSQWEKSAPWTCNIDYLFANSPSQISYLKIDTTNIDVLEDTLFDVKYANWHKDLFMGVLPSAQFGDAASVDLSSLIDATDFTSYLRSTVPAGDAVFVNEISEHFQSVLVNQNDTAPSPLVGFGKGTVEYLAHCMGLTPQKLSSVFTILALRQAEAMQKWKEITQSTQQDYKSQMEAHFGVSLSDAYSERCKFIDGFVNNVDISEVVNTNLAYENLEAEIAGKGVGVGDTSLSFESKVHGYIMCIYHAVPLLDYSSTGISRQNLKTNVIDYAIPEFDQTGMVQVPLVELSNRRFASEEYQDIKFLGYAPRYYDYKQDKDEVHGGFYNGGDESWVAPIDDSYIREYLASIPRTSKSIDYRFFKISPQVVDTIFGINANDETYSDHLLINCGFDVKAVRNLDYNGLPY